MDTNKLFSVFNSIIKLNDSKISKLKTNRKALRDKIREHFKSNGWEVPKFYSQGSFPLNTNLNPINRTTANGDVQENYDLDDGVYFICQKSDRKEPITYHDRIIKAVEGHADRVVDKTTCVRVVYADGHHIDLPSYWIGTDGDIPLLAHKSKGYIESDPKAFKDWVENEISNANSNGQLRRIIRYLKAWKDHRENQNNNIKLPSGFILTILACQNFSSNSCDDLSLKATVENIKKTLDSSFTCYRPTMPKDEELLESYSEDIFLKELGNLIDNAKKALESDNKNEASEFWRKVFGDRFPQGKEKDDQPTQPINAQLTRVKVSKPWLSY